MKTTKQLARELGLLRKRSLSKGSAQDGAKKQRTSQAFSYLIVIDFESTCWENDKTKTQEIIEFPAVLLNTLTGEIESEFHFYLMPQEHPTLSSFCRQLTGISQNQVDNGIPLFLCLRKFSHWLHRLSEEKNIRMVGDPKPGTSGEQCFASSSPDHKLAAIVTWSDWDLGVCLHYELRRKQISKAPCFNQWIDLRVTYTKFYGRKPKGLNGALQDVGIEFEGREHSGLHDARNTAKLAWRMIRDGCIMKITKTLSHVSTSSTCPTQPRNASSKMPKRKTPHKKAPLKSASEKGTTPAKKTPSKEPAERKTPAKATNALGMKKSARSPANSAKPMDFKCYEDLDSRQQIAPRTEPKGKLTPRGLKLRNANTSHATPGKVASSTDRKSVTPDKIGVSPCGYRRSPRLQAQRKEEEKQSPKSKKCLMTDRKEDNMISQRLSACDLLPKGSRSRADNHYKTMSAGGDNLCISTSVLDQKQEEVKFTLNMTPQNASSFKQTNVTPLSGGSFKQPSPDSVRPSPVSSVFSNVRNSRTTKPLPTRASFNPFNPRAPSTPLIGENTGGERVNSQQQQQSYSTTPSGTYVPNTTTSKTLPSVSDSATFRTPSGTRVSESAISKTPSGTNFSNSATFKTPSPTNNSNSASFKTPSSANISNTATFKTPSPAEQNTLRKFSSFRTPLQPSQNSAGKMKATPPLCRCGRRAKRRMVQNPGPNMGRWFFSCGKGSQSPASGDAKKAGCSFFQWEPPQGAVSPSVSPFIPRGRGVHRGYPSTSKPFTPVLNTPASYSSHRRVGVSTPSSALKTCIR